MKHFPSLTIRQASTSAALDEVFRIRYECYLRTGAIEPSAAGRFSDAYDQMPNHFSFLMESAESGAIATMRVSVMAPSRGWTQVPASSVFNGHPALREMAREGFVEANRLCFRTQAHRGTFYRLGAQLAALADVYDAGWIVACPRVEHAGTYRRVFGMSRLGEPRRYFGVNFETELLGVRREDLRRTANRTAKMLSAWREAFVTATGSIPGVDSGAPGAGPETCRCCPSAC